MARKNANKKNQAKKNSQALVPTSRAMFKAANGYTNNSKTRGAVVNTRFNAPRRGRRAPPSHLPPVLSAFIDPWGDSADGVRYPDEYRGYSGTFASTLEGRIETPGTFTDLNMVGVTNAPGTSIQLFTPDPSNAVVTGVCGNNSAGVFAGTPNQFHWPNGIAFTNAGNSLNAFGPGTGINNIDVNLPNIKAMRNMYHGARLVAGGVRLSGTMNFSTVSGTVHLAPIFVSLSPQASNGGEEPGSLLDPTGVIMQNGWQCQLPANLADMSNLPGYASFPLSALQTDEVAAVFKRFDPAALNFKPVSHAWGMANQHDTPELASRFGDSEIPNNYGHYCIMMFIDGVLNNAGEPSPPGTAIAEFEMRNHYECEFSGATSANLGGIASSAGMATRAPPYQPLLMAAVDNLTSDIPAVRIVDDAGVSETSFMAEVARAWKGAVGVATSVAAAFEIGVPLLAALAL